MEDLKVTIIQSDLRWEDKELNLSMFSEKIDSIKDETDLIVLPEMFTTGFSMNPNILAEPMTGNTISWMQQKAKEKNCVITGSFICEEKGKHLNRLAWVRPDGSFSVYDKRHLFSIGSENDHYRSGNKKIIVEIKGWKICPLICYDIRFPVWSRKTKEYNYDVLIYVANWPEKRVHAWKTLLDARAIENQCYVIGVNRIGNDGNGIYHSGNSAVIDPLGKVISHLEPFVEGIETINLSYSELVEFKNTFPAYKDADAFEIKN